MTSSISQEAKFLDLVERVKACKKCSRMADSLRVIGPGCGPLDSDLLFIGEAPGRLGADGSHLPFHGDKSGHNFEELIEQVGISRYEVFVTNAVLCNPKDERGNNSTPTTTEILNCAPFLKETIELVNSPLVVTLGAVALKSCGILSAHALSLREGVRTSTRWMGRALIPLYHPGQRAMVHRSFANQLSDYQFVAETLRRLRRPVKVSSRSKPRAKPGRVAQVAQQLLANSPKGLSYFALHKLCFLAEIAHLESTGTRLTNAYVVRQKDGPYFVDLHVTKLPRLIEGIKVDIRDKRIWLNLPKQRDLLSIDDGEIYRAVQITINKYGSLSDAELKNAVYMNKYMRAMLRKERSLGANFYNAPVLPPASF